MLETTQADAATAFEARAAGKCRTKYATTMHATTAQASVAEGRRGGGGAGGALVVREVWSGQQGVWSWGVLGAECCHAVVEAPPFCELCRRPSNGSAVTSGRTVHHSFMPIAGNCARRERPNPGMTCCWSANVHELRHWPLKPRPSWPWIRPRTSPVPRAYPGQQLLDCRCSDPPIVSPSCVHPPRAVNCARNPLSPP